MKSLEVLFVRLTFFLSMIGHLATIFPTPSFALDQPQTTLPLLASSKSVNRNTTAILMVKTFLTSYTLSILYISLFLECIDGDNGVCFRDITLSSALILILFWMSSRDVSTLKRRRFKTLFERHGRQMDVKTTLCAN